MESRVYRDTEEGWDCAGCNIFLSLVVVGSLFPAIYLEPKVFIATGIAYLLLVCDTVTSQTRSFLTNVMKVTDLKVYLENLSAAPPHIRFKIQNYHYE